MRHIHFIGIGGAGLSAIATVLLQQGNKISGSDIQASSTTARLRELGATIFIGHQAENLIDQPDVVVISSAIGEDNSELNEARQRGLAISKRAKWLGQMMVDKVGVAIAGTHGKTTTTAMTAYLLQQAGLEPTYIVGGFIPQLNTNAAAGKGNLFVIEADEYDHMFLGLRPQLAILTIVEWDHPDMYQTQDDLHQAFVDFIQLVPNDGLIIGCGDDPGVQGVIKQSQIPTITYGLEGANDWQAINLRPNHRGGYDFEMVSSNRTNQIPISLSLALPGVHNVCNALAALVVANNQGVELLEAVEILRGFTGVTRRFEVKGEVEGITVIDDYAHHPTEVRATLAGARTRFRQHSLWVVFQPHTFSRTLALFDDFLDAFDLADHVIVVDIYASREVDAGLINSQQLVEQMNHPDARYIGPLTKAADYLVKQLTPPAVLLTLGAGDGYRVGEEVLDRLVSERIK